MKQKRMKLKWVAHMPRKNKLKRKNRKSNNLEKFAKQQMKKYIEIHKENEKDLRYIG